MSRRHPRIVLLLVAFCCFGCELANAASWDAGGGANRSWGNSLNWTGDAIPLPGDDVLFNDTGASNSPGTTTVLLDMARSVAGFTVENPTNKFHTFNLNGFALE